MKVDWSKNLRSKVFWTSTFSTIMIFIQVLCLRLGYDFEIINKDITLIFNGLLGWAVIAGVIDSYERSDEDKEDKEVE